MDHKAAFIEKAISIYQNRYDYSNLSYENSYTPINIECVEHGTFSVLPKNHVNPTRKQGCPKCDSNGSRYTLDRTGSFDAFVKRAELQHGDRYIYLPENYTKMREPATIICPAHGPFVQEAKYHIKAKVGCRFCYYEDRIERGLNGGYSIDYFKTNQEDKNKPARLYVVEILFKDGTTCTKVGITVKTVKQRFHTNPRDKIESITTLYEYEDKLYDVFITEQQIISELYPYKFKPTHKFDGYTECFRQVPEVAHILSSYFPINISYE